VTAAAALPIAITGAVGAGMLSAMMGASARLQTSSSLLGQAWNNVWRPIGDKVDQLFIRPVVLDLLGETQRLGEAIRTGNFLQFGGSIRDIFTEGDTGAILHAMVPGGLSIRLLGWFQDEISDVNWRRIVPDVPDFPGWPSLPKFTWPSLPDFSWPDIGVPDLPDWSSLRPPMPDWSGIDLSLPDWLRRWTSGATDTIDGVTDVGGGDTIEDPYGGNRPIPDPGGPAIGLQSGGRVVESGRARVHRGELVTDEERLVSELASAVSQSTGGRSRSMDTSGMERKLDRLHDDLRRLESALDVTLEVGREEIGRAAADGKRQDISDSNPRV
jgi:hypothetical protein